MDNFPCNDCITLASCKSLVSTLKPTRSLTTVLFDKCSIMDKYLTSFKKDDRIYIYTKIFPFTPVSQSKVIKTLNFFLGDKNK